MDVNTILLISSLLFQLISEVRRSRCTHIELSSNGLVMDRKVLEKEDDNNNDNNNNNI
jgi:MoaA/NifB/PqqE/SkfB family radical SAM enzyme